MKADIQNIRAYRLRTHHLDKKISASFLEQAAGACGLQNSPPGAWETDLFNRLQGCTQQMLHDALYKQKNLLQAWSYRGVPVVFPTSQSDVFLSPLVARPGEDPWIYTRGITAGLDHMQMGFDDLLPLVMKAAGHLDKHTIKSKERLDSTLAEIVQRDWPEKKQRLWNAPSMYGSPDKQTVGGAIVSFMLRPCSFNSLVVFGERQGNSPTFTSFKRWTGHLRKSLPDAGKALTRKYLHCYGPSNVASFAAWLGSSPQQAKRLWNSISDEMQPVQVDGKASYMLSSDMEDLMRATSGDKRMILLGAHDPFLDMRDREVILHDKAKQLAVWKTVANPNVILEEGNIIGIWKTKTTAGSLEITMTLWQNIKQGQQKALKTLAEEYAEFRSVSLKNCLIESG